MKKIKELTYAEAEKMWQEAGIANDFIFYQCFRNVNILKPFLEAVLGKQIHHVELINAQHEIRPGMLSKYIRCDVFVEGEDGVYIVEMQCGNYADLFLRARYDHSASDVDQARRGTSYNELGESIVIYICYDHPFKGSHRRMLTGHTVFLEQPELPYNDKVKTIFLDAAGTEGEVHPVIQNFLNYVRDSSQGLHDPFVQMVDNEVKEVKNLEENHQMFITEEMEKRANEVRIQRAVEAERKAGDERLKKEKETAELKLQKETEAHQAEMQQMQKKAEEDKKNAIIHAASKASRETISAMIRTMHQNEMSAESISTALSMDQNEVETILHSSH